MSPDYMVRGGDGQGVLPDGAGLDDMRRSDHGLHDVRLMLGDVQCIPCLVTLSVGSLRAHQRES